MALPLSRSGTRHSRPTSMPGWSFADCLLPFGAREARHWGQLSARLGHSGADLLIAATALACGATVVTENVSDFAPAGVMVENPFLSGAPVVQRRVRGACGQGSPGTKVLTARLDEAGPYRTGDLLVRGFPWVLGRRNLIKTSRNP